MGNNEIYKMKHWLGLFLVHNFSVPHSRPPPSSLLIHPWPAPLGAVVGGSLGGWEYGACRERSMTPTGAHRCAAPLGACGTLDATAGLCDHTTWAAPVLWLVQMVAKRPMEKYGFKKYFIKSQLCRAVVEEFNKIKAVCLRVECGGGA